MRIDNNPPFCQMPPSELMVNASSLDEERDFASHGCDIYEALSKVSAIPLADYEKILDFGCDIDF